MMIFIISINSFATSNAHNTISDGILYLNPPEEYKGRTLIYLEKAVVIALDDAKIPYDIAYIEKKNFSYEQGTIIYNIYFNNKKTNDKYVYTINAMNGDIITKEKQSLNSNNEYYVVSFENLFPNGINNISKDIGKEKVIEILLSKIKGATKENIEMRENIYENRKYYEGYVEYDNVVYNFKIDAEDGLVIDFDKTLGKEINVSYPDTFVIEENMLK